jgi:hypothetical protein
VLSGYEACQSGENVPNHFPAGSRILNWDAVRERSRNMKEIMREYREIHEANGAEVSNQQVADVRRRLDIVNAESKAKSPLVIRLLLLGAISVPVAMLVLPFFKRLQFSKAQRATFNLLFLVDVVFLLLPGLR